MDLTLVCPCIFSTIANDDQQNATILVYLFIPNQLYVFRAMSSPIIRKIWLYLQLLILSNDIAAGWCHGWDGTDQQDVIILSYLFIPNQLYMYRAMYSPIIRSTWLIYSFWYCPPILLPAGVMDEVELNEFHLVLLPAGVAGSNIGGLYQKL